MNVEFHLGYNATNSTTWIEDATVNSTSIYTGYKAHVNYKEKFSSYGGYAIDESDYTTSTTGHTYGKGWINSTTSSCSAWLDAAKATFEIKWKCANGWYNVDKDVKVVPLADRMRAIIQDRQIPAIHVSRFLKPPEDLREICARQTLLRVLGEQDYRKFLKNGFVSVRGKSGLIYQIFPAHGITNVYNRGEMVERLCVVMMGNFPPTDSLIMRYLLILNDEQDFRRHAIKHQVFVKQKKVVMTISESLIDIFKREKTGLKIVA